MSIEELHLAEKKLINELTVLNNRAVKKFALALVKAYNQKRKTNKREKTLSLYIEIVEFYTRKVVGPNASREAYLHASVSVKDMINKKLLAGESDPITVEYADMEVFKDIQSDFDFSYEENLNHALLLSSKMELTNGLDSSFFLNGPILTGVKISKNNDQCRCTVPTLVTESLNVANLSFESFSVSGDFHLVSSASIYINIGFSAPLREYLGSTKKLLRLHSEYKRLGGLVRIL